MRHDRTDDHSERDRGDALPNVTRPGVSWGDRLHHQDRGYTLVELILVVAILAVLGAVAILALTGMSSEAAETGCHADRRQVHVAAEAYFAQRGADTIPATGTDADRFERTLVAEDFLRGVSQLHALAADGAVAPEEGSPCAA